MRSLLRVFKLLLILAIALGIGLGVLIATLDPNDYRSQIAQALSEATKAKVTLAGTLEYRLSWREGLSLTVNDATIEHAAARVHADKVDLGLALPLLLRKQIVLTHVTLVGASVDSGAASAKPAEERTTSEADQGAEAAKVRHDAAAHPVALQIDTLRVLNSVVRHGTTTVAIDELEAALGLNTTRLKGRLAVDALPVRFELEGGDWHTLLSAGKDAQAFPFTLRARVGEMEVAAKTGRLDLAKQQLAFEGMTAMAGASSRVHGTLAVSWQNRPLVQGTLFAPRLDVQEMVQAFAPAQAVPAGTASAPVSAPVRTNRLFDDTTLNVAPLRALDALLSLTIERFTAGGLALESLTTKVVLKEGVLLLSPLSARKGESALQGQLKLDARQHPPLHLSLNAQGTDVVLGDLISHPVIKSLLVGKARLNTTLISYGQSMHDLASNAEGVLNLESTGGALTAFNTLASTGLFEAAVPGLGTINDPRLNCLAARASIAKGVMRLKGPLADTNFATLIALGTVDLGNEVLDLRVLTKAKGELAAKLALDFAPPIYVTGSLMKPTVQLKPTASTVIKLASKIGGSFKDKLGGLIDPFVSDGLSTDSVPEVEAQTGDLNACLVALDRPTPVRASPQQPIDTKPLTPSIAAQVGDKAKDALNSLGNILR